MAEEDPEASKSSEKGSREKEGKQIIKKKTKKKGVRFFFYFLGRLSFLVLAQPGRQGIASTRDVCVAGKGGTQGHQVKLGDRACEQRL